MEFTIEYWFRYKVDEQDFEVEKIVADTYENAKKFIRNSWRNSIFKYTDKTKYSDELRRKELSRLIKRK